MFQNRRINTKGAQLIFVGHNTNVLNAHLLRRDQVWITQKNKYGGIAKVLMVTKKQDLLSPAR
jgi:hypothetical protein